MDQFGGIEDWKDIRRSSGAWMLEDFVDSKNGTCGGSPTRTIQQEEAKGECIWTCGCIKYRYAYHIVRLYFL